MNKYFCVLPFFGYEFHPKGYGTHCCLLPQDYDINAVRASMLAQQRPSECGACWRLEDAGLVSDRTLKNAALDFYWDRDINRIEQQVREGQYSPIMIKNITSSTCNSTCVTCDSGASTAWATLERKINIVPQAPRIMTREEIDNNLDYANLVTLNFVGGEPLYEKLNFYILEQLLAHNNARCFITFTTNGSVEISPANQELLKQFKNINIGISIDGTGPVFEYMRFPLKWDQLLHNLEFFRTITDNITASYTTSNLNVLYHNETIAWFQEQNLRYHYNPIINPGHFRPAALPLAVKKEIIARLGANADMDFYVGSHSEQDDRDYEQMIKTVIMQDRAKAISIRDYLPAFCNMLDDLADHHVPPSPWSHNPKV
jgi:sulfatase maturation enzyme AslB (radical SAM superfamily)